MSTVLLLSLILIPLGVHLLLTAFVYYDTAAVPLERRKWTFLVGAIPMFGFFMYLFERSELDYDPETDPYAGNGYNVHPSREDDFPLSSSRTDDTDHDPTAEERERVEDEDREQ